MARAPRGDGGGVRLERGARSSRVPLGDEKGQHHQRDGDRPRPQARRLARRPGSAGGVLAPPRSRPQGRTRSLRRSSSSSARCSRSARRRSSPTSTSCTSRTRSASSGATRTSRARRTGGTRRRRTAGPSKTTTRRSAGRGTRTPTESTAWNSGLWFVQATAGGARLMALLAHRMATENTWDQTAFNEEVWRAGAARRTRLAPTRRRHAARRQLPCFANSKTLFRRVLRSPVARSSPRATASSSRT